MPVIGNVSAPATRATVAAAEALRDCPVTGVAATHRTTTATPQDELLDHFRAIADRCAQPLWVYNIPSTVKVTVEPDTIAALAADGHRGGGQGQLGRRRDVRATRDAVPQARPRPVPVSWLRLARHDGRVRRARHHPGIANLAPRSMSTAWEAGQRDDQETAGRCLDQVLAATGVTRIRAGGSAGSGFSGLKCALKLMGIIEHDTLSAPFQGWTKRKRSRYRRCWRRQGSPPSSCMGLRRRLFTTAESTTPEPSPRPTGRCSVRYRRSGARRSCSSTSPSMRSGPA